MGKGASDGGSVDVDFSDCAFYASYTPEFSHVAKLKCYVKGMNSEVAMNLPGVIADHGGTGFALTVIGVDFIGIEGCLIEIEATVVH